MTLKVVLLGTPRIEIHQFIEIYSRGLIVEEMSENSTRLECVARIKESDISLKITGISIDSNFETRNIVFSDANLFLCFFNIQENGQLEHLTDSVIREVMSMKPETPIFIVGLGAEARRDAIRKLDIPTTFMHGCNTAREMGLSGYFEASLVEQKGILDVFSRTLESAFEHLRKSNSFVWKKKSHPIFGHDYYSDDSNSHQIEYILKELHSEKRAREKMFANHAEMADTIVKQQLEIEKLRLHVKSLEDTWKKNSEREELEFIKKRIEDDENRALKSPREIKIFSTTPRSVFSPRIPEGKFDPRKSKPKDESPRDSPEHSYLTKMLGEYDWSQARKGSEGELAQPVFPIDDVVSDDISRSLPPDSKIMKSPTAQPIDIKALTKNTDGVIARRRKSSVDGGEKKTRQSFTLGQVPKDVKGTWSLNQIKSRTFSEPVLMKDLPPTLPKIKSENNVMAPKQNLLNEPNSPEMQSLSPDSIIGSPEDFGSPPTLPKTITVRNLAQQLKKDTL